MKKLLPWLPGIAIFLSFFIWGLSTHKNYGISWDEPDTHLLGEMVYDYVFNGKKDLLNYEYKFYGSGYDLVQVIIEKISGVKDTREIYFQRHLTTHTFFLLAGLAIYIMAFRSSRNWIIASITSLIFLSSPRIFAHSYFNTKDIPFLCMFAITMAAAQLAFDKNKTVWYALLGVCAGYATSIRVMGILLFTLIIVMLLIDLVRAGSDGAKKRSQLIKLATFTLVYFVTVYIAWPYLWANPIENFQYAFTAMSKYNWAGNVLIKGNFESALSLPTDYFPTWFGISTPVLWIPAGLAGLALIVVDFFKQKKVFISNSPQRIYLFVAACFLAPVIAVLQFHSVLYDDWRHLYFIWPAFSMMACYLMMKFYNEKTRFVYVAVTLLQLAMVGGFVASYHPYEQVYFNELVSHDEEYLRNNYELDYWGCSYKSGLEYIVQHDTAATINIAADYNVLVMNNRMILPERDRNRIKLVEFSKAKYFITNFRAHPDDFPDKDHPSKDIDFNIKVLNSSILRVYNLTNINKLNVAK